MTQVICREKSQLSRLGLGALALFFWVQPTYPQEPTIAPSASATEQWVAQYGCGQLKAWSQSGVDYAFAQWAQRVSGTSVRGPALEVAASGSVAAALGSMGQLYGLIDLSLEITAGDPARAGQKASTLALDAAATAIGGPGATVYTIVKELGALASALDQEIHDLNLANYARAAVGDRSLLELNRYLDGYLHWTEPSPAGVPALEMNRRRGMLYTYATRSLGQASFPRFLDWQEHRNVVRATAAALLTEVRGLVELYDRQQRLARQIPQLQSAVQAVEQFQAFWSSIRSLTCRDSGQNPCQQRLPELAAIVASAESTTLSEIDASALTKAQGALAKLTALLDGIESEQPERTDRIAAHCADQISLGTPAERVRAARQRRAEITALIESADQSRSSACSASDLASAEHFEAQTAAFADQARSLAESLRPDEPPPLGVKEIDWWSDVQIPFFRAEDSLRESSRPILESQEKRLRVLEILASAQPIVELCRNEAVAGPLQDLRFRMLDLDSRATTGIEEASAALEQLNRQLELERARWRWLKRQDEQSNACMAELQSSFTGLADLQDEYHSASADATRAEEIARGARRCAGLEDEGLDLPPIELELLHPAGPSPNVFTTGWVFGARAMIQRPEGPVDLSSQVHWSGSGSFAPAVGAVSRPSFSRSGANYLVLEIEIEGQFVRRRFDLEAVDPLLYAGIGDQSFREAVPLGPYSIPTIDIGPITTGSTQVTVRGVPAARVGDRGIASVCGQFTVLTGDSSVLIDGLAAARIGDRTQACGDLGEIVYGHFDPASHLADTEPASEPSVDEAPPTDSGTEAAAIATGAAQEAAQVAAAAISACQTASAELQSPAGHGLELLVANAESRLAAVASGSVDLLRLVQRALAATADTDAAIRELADLRDRAAAVRDRSCSPPGGAGVQTRSAGFEGTSGLTASAAGLLDRVSAGARIAREENELLAGNLIELGEILAALDLLDSTLADARAAIERARLTLEANDPTASLAEATAVAEVANTLATNSVELLPVTSAARDRIAGHTEAVRQCRERTAQEIERALRQVQDLERRAATLREEASSLRAVLSGGALGELARAAAEADGNLALAEPFTSSIHSRVEDALACGRAAAGAEPAPPGETSNTDLDGSGWGGGTVVDRESTRTSSSTVGPESDCDLAPQQFRAALKRADSAIAQGSLDGWFKEIAPLAKAGCAGPELDQSILAAGRMEAEASRRRDQLIAEATRESRSRIRPGVTLGERLQGDPSGDSLGDFLEMANDIANLARSVQAVREGRPPPPPREIVSRRADGILVLEPTSQSGAASPGPGGTASSGSQTPGPGSQPCCPEGWDATESFGLLGDLGRCVRRDRNGQEIESSPVGTRWQEGPCLVPSR